MLPFEIENRMQAIRAEVERDGIELLEVHFRRSGSMRGVLTLIVDKPGGVTLDDCADVNRRLGSYLDREAETEAGFLGGSYYLEVNSPGLDRPLRTPKDFERAKGERVRVAWKAENGAGLVATGDLLQVSAESIEVGEKNGPLRISFTAITKASRDVKA